MMDMVSDDKCMLCNKIMEHPYKPMKEWKIDGTLCGDCYSKKIADFYPGEHVRVDLTKDT